MSRYRLTTSARVDLKEIIRYIIRDNPEVGRRLKDKIKQQCQLLAKYPNMGGGMNLRLR